MKNKKRCDKFAARRGISKTGAAVIIRFSFAKRIGRANERMKHRRLFMRPIKQHQRYLYSSGVRNLCGPRIAPKSRRGPISSVIQGK